MWNKQKAEFICFAAWPVPVSHTQATVAEAFDLSQMRRLSRCIQTGWKYKRGLCGNRWTWDLQASVQKVTGCVRPPARVFMFLLLLLLLWHRACCVRKTRWCEQGWSLSTLSSQSASSDLWPLAPTRHFPSLTGLIQDQEMVVCENPRTSALFFFCSLNVQILQWTCFFSLPIPFIQSN